MTGNVIVQVMESHGVSLAQIEAGTSSKPLVTEATIETTTMMATAEFTSSSSIANNFVNSQTGTQTVDFKTYEIAAAISFIMGIIMPLASFLRLGFISIYLSDQFLSGFTTAAALYIFTSQLRYLTGVHLPYRSGYLAIVYTVYDLIIEWKHINISCLIISAVAMAILLFSKIYVNKWLFRLGIQIPFPIELLVVIGATVISSIFNFHGNYNVPIVGHIQAG